MRYLPHTEEDVQQMLEVIGLESLTDLFSTVPNKCWRKKKFELPAPLSEWDLNSHMNQLAGKMAVPPEYNIFMGGGSYPHYIPAVVMHLLSRSEFTTSYTPYQPEISQGTLQAIYEYQTLVSRLLGLDVANASMYDGASALAEALLMAMRITRRQKVAVSRAIHPLYRNVIDTYLAPTGCEIIELPYLTSGRTDASIVNTMSDLAAVAVQSPNFFGCIESLDKMSAMVHKDEKALLVTSFTEPLAYGLYKSPGSQGADIACGEGQSFGIPQSFGGPGLGMFAAKAAFMRNMPGRLVGQTTDVEGKRGFVLTLATREQHIRRERATSNICSNQGLCATASAMYMATLGGTGIRRLAKLNFDKAEYLKQELRRIGCELPFAAATFNEFVVGFPKGFEIRYEALMDEKIVAGLPLEPYYPNLAGHYLLCVTETSKKEDMDRLVKEVTS